MPAYTYTTNNLIRDAYKLISYIDLNATLDNAELQQGLEMLNEILSVDENDAAVPFFETISFEFTPNQSIYEFAQEQTNDDSVLITTNPITLVRNIQMLYSSQTRIPIEPRNQDQFKNVMKSQQVQGQPTEYYFYKEQNTSFIEFWPVPNSNWVCEVSCKIMFDQQTANSSLPSIPTQYYRYLKYSLAKEIAASYNDTMWTQRHQDTYQTLYEQVRASAAQDYTLQVSGALLTTRVYPIANNLILP